jgi:GTP-binding protein
MLAAPPAHTLTNITKGTNGLGKSMHGQKGNDAVVLVPPGTIIRDVDGVLAGELNDHGQRLLVASGGRGGRGNEHFRTPRNKAPTFAEKGEEGDVRWLNVELKLIADVGFIGVPNAGKSTLLAASSNAKPKIADYQFTTVVPNLGMSLVACTLSSMLTHALYLAP